jgi:hypothetical protein
LSQQYVRYRVAPLKRTPQSAIFKIDRSRKTS